VPGVGGEVPGNVVLPRPGLTGRRFRGNVVLRRGVIRAILRTGTAPGRCVAGAWPAGQGFGADGHDHVVGVRVARGGDLPRQVRPGHFHQRIGQARPAGAVAFAGPGAGVRVSRGVIGGRGVLSGVGMSTVRVLAVTGRGAQRLQHHGPVRGWQLGGDGDRPVLGHLNAHPPLGPVRQLGQLRQSPAARAVWRYAYIL
jgi:hypothetical protein